MTQAPLMMATFVKSVAHGPINEANQLGWDFADKKANEALRRLQEKGAKVVKVELTIQSRQRLGSTIIYTITYTADRPI